MRHRILQGQSPVRNPEVSRGRPAHVAQDENNSRPVSPDRSEAAYLPGGRPTVGAPRATRVVPAQPMAPPPVGDGLIQELLRRLFDLEDAGAPLEEITRIQRRLDLARSSLSYGFQPEPSRLRAGPINTWSVLSKVRDPPKLGTTRRGPSPQQVEAWVRAVENLWALLDLQEDDSTRTRWTVGLLEFETHRELMLRAVDDGSVSTWAQIQKRVRELTQDPILTKFENYFRFWNVEWRSSDKYNDFMNYFTRFESALESPPFQGPRGEELHELKISVVWSKLPDPIRREMQRNGSLQNVKVWSDFERAVRNAETATRDEAPRAPRVVPGAQNASSKRIHSGSVPQDRKFKRPAKQSDTASTTSNSRSQSTASQPRSEGKSQNWRDDSDWPRKPHWKHRDNRDKPEEKDAGKGKP
ncbi:hypothetical protein K491DRAFT_347627 [Lophiostoma macrostomum CBS 122681]|uniref:Uncharacterized protein n=1 Tax=Lophiostoma macrostomum CBS 122681 TaxID=1314788 RepID=A0A6A6SGQ3_9PLEO|nr:hypothetical protein K491DRAFT_347627 [Lophiostoma macrostomum CBS 122681]